MQTSIAAPPHREGGSPLYAGHSPDALLGPGRRDQRHPAWRLVIRSLDRRRVAGSRTPTRPTPTPSSPRRFDGRHPDVRHRDGVRRGHRPRPDLPALEGRPRPRLARGLGRDHRGPDPSTSSGSEAGENLSIPQRRERHRVERRLRARKVISLVIPAQTSTGGTATLGFQGPGGRIYAPTASPGSPRSPTRRSRPLGLEQRGLWRTTSDARPAPRPDLGRERGRMHAQRAVYARCCASGSGGASSGSSGPTTTRTPRSRSRTRWVASASAGASPSSVNFG